MTPPFAYAYIKSPVNYLKALEWQSRIVTSRLRSPSISTDPDLLILLQHPPTYTAGRRVRGEWAQQEANRLRALGADYYETPRGGQITFHGPGQLVGYPIVNLTRRKTNVRCYVNDLESVMIKTCRHFGLETRRTEDTGVWIGSNKIAALGIHLSENMTSHGFALNCNTDLTWFQHFVPCGLQGKWVTSVTKELQKGTETEVNVGCEDALDPLLNAFQDVFKTELVPVSEVPEWSKLVDELQNKE